MKALLNVGPQVLIVAAVLGFVVAAFVATEQVNVGSLLRTKTIEVEAVLFQDRLAKFMSAVNNLACL